MTTVTNRPRRRRRQSHTLERVLGAPALFATAYGNVGSSIYYALGLVAGIALGLTPLVFIVSVNILLAVVDFTTQLLLVILGFFLIFNAHVLWHNVHFGVAPSWSAFLLAIPVGMIAYTGIETVSNLAEEARDPVRSIPRSISWVAIAVFAIYFTLPWIALSAMPVVHQGSHYVTQLGQPPPHGFKNDPVLGLVQNLNLHGFLLDAAKVYVGILASTILFVATNAGVIGASRITYSMASYRQLPEVFRRLHPKLKTPWLALVVFGGIGTTIFLLSGQVDFLGRMYAFGAMLSFTIAHVAVIALRVRGRQEELEWRARPSIRFRGIEWPLFAIVGGLGTGIAWLVVVVQDAPTRYAGFAWLAAGFVFYVLYRRKLHLGLTTTTRAPVPLGAALALEYRSILVPIVAGEE